MDRSFVPMVFPKTKNGSFSSNFGLSQTKVSLCEQKMDRDWCVCSAHLLPWFHDTRSTSPTQHFRHFWWIWSFHKPIWKSSADSQQSWLLWTMIQNTPHTIIPPDQTLRVTRLEHSVWQVCQLHHLAWCWITEISRRLKVKRKSHSSRLAHGDLLLYLLRFSACSSQKNNLLRKIGNVSDASRCFHLVVKTYRRTPRCGNCISKSQAQKSDEIQVFNIPPTLG